MALINLRDFYPHHIDCIVEVPDEVIEVLRQADRLEKNYIRRRYYNNAYYSLDAGDGIEHDTLFPPLTPFEVYEQRLRVELLYTALDSLPDKQRMRVYAHYILGFSKAEIARIEHVSQKAVSLSITAGLRQMKKILGNFFK